MAELEGIRTGRHCIFALHVHLVFVTKFRHKVFADRHLNRLEEIMRAVCTDFECELVEFNGEGEHVHLLVFPQRPGYDISALLYAIKRPFSFRMKDRLLRENLRLASELSVRERPGKIAFRFWQEGPGYDRNLQTPASVQASIEYIHNNPVKRRLVSDPRRWKWSSARYYLSDGQQQDPDLPRITPMPAEFWT